MTRNLLPTLLLALLAVFRPISIHGGGADVVQVFSVTIGYYSTGLKGTVKVVDGNNVKVNGATVEAEWTKPDGTKITIFANQGVDWARVALPGGVDQCGTYSIQVVNVVKSGYKFRAKGQLTDSFDVAYGCGDPSPTSAPASGPIPMTIPDIFMWRQGRNVVADVFVEESGSMNPVVGASVSATWTLPDGTTIQDLALTDTDGIASMNQRKSSGTFTIQVADVTKPGFALDAIGVMTTTFTV